MTADDLIGQRYGTRTVIAVVSRGLNLGTGYWIVRAICECGRVQESELRIVRRAKACPSCRRKAEGAAERAATVERWRPYIGRRLGTRTIVDVVRIEAGPRPKTVFVMRCDCGDELHRECSADALKTHGCRKCTPRGERPEPEPTTKIEWILSASARAHPDVWRSDTPESVEAIAELVDVLGRPLSYGEMSALLGVTRQRIDQIEHGARKRLARNAEARELAAEVEPRDEGSWSTWSDSAEASAGRGW